MLKTLKLPILYAAKCHAQDYQIHVFQLFDTFLILFKFHLMSFDLQSFKIYKYFDFIIHCQTKRKVASPKFLSLLVVLLSVLKNEQWNILTSFWRAFLGLLTDRGRTRGKSPLPNLIFYRSGGGLKEVTQHLRF